MAEGLDLASTPVGGEIPQERLANEAAEDSKNNDPEESPKMTRNVKRKLVLKDDPKKVKERKMLAPARRHRGRGVARKQGPGKAFDPVNVSSEEDKTPHKKKKNTIVSAGQEESSPANLEEGPTVISSQPAHEVEVKHPTTTSAAQEEPFAPDLIVGEEQIAQEGLSDDEERYQQKRKRKGKVPIKKKETTKKLRVVPTAITIREPQPNQRVEEEESTSRDCDDTETELDSDDNISLEDEEYQDQPLEFDNKLRELIHPSAERGTYKKWRSTTSYKNG